SARSVAATEIMYGFAGVASKQPQFPADATTTPPRLRTYWAALVIALLPATPPMLMFMTFAPWSAAHVRPLTIVEAYANPVASVTRIGMIRLCHATDATPVTLSPMAAAVPATQVPWPYTSDAFVLPS